LASGHHSGECLLPWVCDPPGRFPGSQSEEILEQAAPKLYERKDLRG
jgi:hypothetical protein